MGGDNNKNWENLIGLSLIKNQEKIGVVRKIDAHYFYVKTIGESNHIKQLLKPMIYKEIDFIDFYMPFQKSNCLNEINLIYKIFFQLLIKYEVNTNKKIDPSNKLYEIMRKLEYKYSLTKNDYKWLNENKFFSILANYYENRYSENHNLHEAKFAFYFWFKDKNLTKAMYWSSFVVSECDKLINDVLSKIREPVSENPTNYPKYLSSSSWKIIRNISISRATNKCQVCNSAEKLNVHHRKYETGKEKIQDLLVPCQNCHELFSRNGKLDLFDILDKVDN